MKGLLSFSSAADGGGGGVVKSHLPLSAFALFPAPLKLLEGDFPFQVLDKFGAEPRHFCSGGEGSNNPESLVSAKSEEAGGVLNARDQTVRHLK